MIHFYEQQRQFVFEKLNIVVQMLIKGVTIATLLDIARFTT